MRTTTHHLLRHHCKFRHLPQHPHRAALRSDLKSGHVSRVAPRHRLLYFSCVHVSTRCPTRQSEESAAQYSQHASFTPLPDVTLGRFGSAVPSLYVRFTPLLVWELWCAGFRHSAGLHARATLDDVTCQPRELGDVRDVFSVLGVWWDR